MRSAGAPPFTDARAQSASSASIWRWSAVRNWTASCVEGAVISEAMGVIADGKPKLLDFGVSDEQAWEVGLACGGRVQVFVEPAETGGYKGYGYATVVEILSASLQGGAFLKALTGTNLGHFFMAVDVEAFTELDAFKKMTGDILRGLRASRRMPPSPGRPSRRWAPPKGKQHVENRLAPGHSRRWSCRASARGRCP